MLKRFIIERHNFSKIDNKDSPQVLLKTFVSSRRTINSKYYCLQIDRKSISFFQQYNIEKQSRSELVNKGKEGNLEGSGKWNIASFFVIVAGIFGYLLVNKKASADAQEDDNKIDRSDLQSSSKIDRLSIKLAEGLREPVENYVDLQGKRQLLDEKLKKQDLVVISGAGGMGKSTLATQYAREYQRKGDMQVVWIKGTQIEEEFLRLAALLEIETNGLDRELIINFVYGNLEKLFGRNQILFIFDNVEVKGKIRQYLINLPNTAKVIITARNGGILDGINPIRIKGFQEEEADFYLRQRLKISEEEAKKITHVVGDESPFRLSIVVGYLKNHPLTSIEELTKQYHEIKSGYSANEEIYPEFKMLFRDLEEDSPKAWELLKYLAYLDAEGVSVSLIGEITGQTVNELQEIVNKTSELSLVKANERIVKVTHRIIQEETKKVLNQEDQEQGQRILEKLINKIEEEFPKINQYSENSEKAKATELVSHAIILMEDAKEIKLPIDIKREDLLEKIGSYYLQVEKIGSYYLQVRFNHSKALNYFEEALINREKRHQGNDADIARCKDNVGRAYRALGGKENILKGLKYHEESLQMMCQALCPDGNPDIAHTLHYLGVGYRELGGAEKIHKAINYYKDSLKMRQKLYTGDHRDVAESLNNLGVAYFYLGEEENIHQGLEYLQRSLNMKKRLILDKHPSMVKTLSNIGRCYVALGGLENIRKGLIEYHMKSLEMRKKLYSGSHPDLSLSHRYIGEAYLALGGSENISEGLKHHLESLKMFQELYQDNNTYTARSLEGVGKAYQALGGIENICLGLRYCEKSLKMHQEMFLGNHVDVAI